MASRESKDHLDFYHQIDADFIKIMCDGYFDYPNPYIKEIKKASDWRNLKPLGKDHPFIRGQVERCRAINDALKGECCTFYNVYNPMSSMRFGCSDEMLMAHLKEDPEAVMYALDVIAEDNAALAEPGYHRRRMRWNLLLCTERRREAFHI